MSFWVLWQTRFGLRLRSCGENPVAAESLGVNVYLHKYIAVVISGAFAGMGGASLVLLRGGADYLENQTNGRGYIGLAAMIFGNWRPGGLLGGAALFGYADGLQLAGGGEAVLALLYGAVILVGVIVVVQLFRRHVDRGRARRRRRRRAVRDLLVERHAAVRPDPVHRALRDADRAGRGFAAAAAAEGRRAAVPAR